MNAGLVRDIENDSLANTSSPYAGVLAKAVEGLRDTPFFRLEERDRDEFCCHERDSGEELFVMLTVADGALGCSESSSVLFGDSTSCRGAGIGVLNDDTGGMASGNSADSACGETPEADADK